MSDDEEREKTEAEKTLREETDLDWERKVNGRVHFLGARIDIGDSRFDHSTIKLSASEVFKERDQVGDSEKIKIRVTYEKLGPMDPDDDRAKNLTIYSHMMTDDVLEGYRELLGDLREQLAGASDDLDEFLGGTGLMKTDVGNGEQDWKQEAKRVYEEKGKVEAVEFVRGISDRGVVASEQYVENHIE